MSMADRITRLEQRIRDQRMPIPTTGTFPIFTIVLEDGDSDLPYVFSSDDRSWLQRNDETLDELKARAIVDAEQMCPPEAGAALFLIAGRSQPVTAP